MELRGQEAEEGERASGPHLITCPLLLFPLSSPFSFAVSSPLSRFCNSFLFLLPTFSPAPASCEVGITGHYFLRCRTYVRSPPPPVRTYSSSSLASPVPISSSSVLRCPHPHNCCWGEREGEGGEKRTGTYDRHKSRIGEKEIIEQSEEREEESKKIQSYAKGHLN